MHVSGGRGTQIGPSGGHLRVWDPSLKGWLVNRSPTRRLASSASTPTPLSGAMMTRSGAPAASTFPCARGPNLNEAGSDCRRDDDAVCGLEHEHRGQKCVFGPLPKSRSGANFLILAVLGLFLAPHGLGTRGKRFLGPVSPPVHLSGGRGTQIGPF